jgi:hypothetical protein
MDGSSMLVFLDFDGVLNAEKDLVDDYTCACVLSREKIELLNRVPAVLPDVRFVLSTSWRNQSFYEIYGHDPRDDLRIHGFRGELHQNWRTPCLKDLPLKGKRASRGDEILAWLANNSFTGSYAILDDCNDFYEDQPLVRTDAWVGLVEEDVDRVIALLTGDKPLPPGV